MATGGGPPPPPRAVGPPAARATRRERSAPSRSGATTLRGPSLREVELDRLTERGEPVEGRVATLGRDVREHLGQPLLDGTERRVERRPSGRGDLERHAATVAVGLAAPYPAAGLEAVEQAGQRRPADRGLAGEVTRPFGG